MACDVPPRECLEWHIKPHLKDARPKTDGSGYRALCPAHDDHDPSFGASIGDNGKVIYGCFKGCDLLAVRRALFDVCGIDLEHLPIPHKKTREVLDEIRDLLTSATKEDTYVRLQVLARVDGYRELPKGGKLVKLGSLIGIGRSQSFDYGKRERERGRTSTANNRQYGAEGADVNNRRSDRRVGTHRKSGNPDLVRKPGPAKVRKPGLLEQTQDDTSNRRPAA